MIREEFVLVTGTVKLIRTVIYFQNPFDLS